MNCSPTYLDTNAKSRVPFFSDLNGVKNLIENQGSQNKVLDSVPVKFSKEQFDANLDQILPQDNSLTQQN